MIVGTYTLLSSSFIQAFNGTAQKYGFNVMLFITNGESEKELVALEMLRSRQLDALVCLQRSNEWGVIESYCIWSHRHMAAAYERHNPLSLHGSVSGITLGLEYLYARGYRSIMNVFSSKGLNTPERIRAYRDFAAIYRLGLHVFLDLHGKVTIRDGEQVARWWIGQDNRPDDVAILGFDNTHLAHLLDLTTVHYPVDKQAENAFSIILSMSGHSAPNLHLLEFELIERKST